MPVRQSFFLVSIHANNLHDTHYHVEEYSEWRLAGLLALSFENQHPASKKYRRSCQGRISIPKKIKK